MDSIRKKKKLSIYQILEHSRYLYRVWIRSIVNPVSDNVNSPREHCQSPKGTLSVLSLNIVSSPRRHCQFP